MLASNQLVFYISITSHLTNKYFFSKTANIFYGETIMVKLRLL